MELGVRAMKRRDIVLAGLTISGMTTFVSRALSWPLITEEQREEISRPQPEQAPAGQAPAGPPTIEVEEPDPTKPIKSPVNIRIKFQAHGSDIDPGSFRAFYGWFDITNRITQHAQITSSGLTANDAEIPAGQYSLTLQISDHLRRVGTRTFRFTVT
jgi:hypothetical protein